MSFDMDMDKLIQRYLKETQNINITSEEVASRPRWKRVWYWWAALEYYENIKRPDLTMDDCKNIYGE